MTTLLEQIRDGAIDSQTDLGDVLRKALVLSYRLGHEEFKQWVERELQGYSDSDPIPPYRIVQTSLKGTFIGGWGSGAKNMPIPFQALPSEFRELETVKLGLPIATYAKMMDQQAASNGLILELPPEICNQIEYIGGQTCVQASRVIAPSLLLSAIENVRNRLLGFVLEIQKTNPAAGEAIGPTPVPLERVSQVFNTQIFGSVGNLVSGSWSVSQSANLQIVQNDLASLERFLRGVGVKEADVEELKQAIEEDESQAPFKERPGAKVKIWIKRVSTSVGAPVIAELIARAIASYFGIGN